jgi:hypothetical protein
MKHEYQGGRHNADLEASRNRLIRGNSYKDVSTVCVIPTRGMIPAKVCNALWSLMTPMNQKFIRITVEGEEVGIAYNDAGESRIIEMEIHAHRRGR